MGNRQTCGNTCAKYTSDCYRNDPGYGDDADDDRPGGDPAGATFEETLEDLNGFDRHLMLFCASSNISAVRWLLYLGAHWESCDANGTTCLHVACRAGAVPIVKEMLLHKPLLDATDMAGWTPLHVAVLMGRTEVVCELLMAGAAPNVKNAKGQLPSELCADSSTFEVLRSHDLHTQQYPDRSWQPTKEMLRSEDIVGNRMQYEPFFVPRQPISHALQNKKELERIGTLIFDRQPGYGLAFLVAMGAVRDYPVDLSAFLRRSNVDILQVGSFLGESFSLSHTIRLELVNSVSLRHTGVVSALIRVLRLLRLPADMQKINRVVHTVARIWWRQHERLAKDAQKAHDVGSPQKAVQDPATKDGDSISDELCGLELRQYMESSDHLHQIMFSAVLLHWYIHGDGNGVRREMDVNTWMKMNRDMSDKSTARMDMSEHMQRQVHGLVSKAFCPELAVAPSKSSHRDGNPDDAGSVASSDPGVPPMKPRSVLFPNASAEGWAQLVGGGFPHPAGLASSQSSSYKHMTSIFSEVTSTSDMTKGSLGYDGAPAIPGLPINGKGAAASAGRGLPARRDEFVWLSLCSSLLFFSPSIATGAPYAFIELHKARVANVQQATKTITLTGSSSSEDVTSGPVVAAAAGSSGDGKAKDGALKPITIVLLLPDGRWQELSLTKLELRVMKTQELQNWVSLMEGVQETSINV